MLERGAHSQNIGIIIIVYALCHGLLLLNQGVFWDDWILINTRSDVIIQTFQFIGFPWLGYVHIFLLNAIGITGYRWIIFCAFLLAGISFYALMVHSKMLGHRDCLWIALFFIVFPVNSARIALINILYAVCYGLFFLAWWLTTLYCEQPRRWLRIIIFMLFFFSFSTGSLLVFYGLVLLYLWYKQGKILGIKFFIYYADWILNPILYWIIRNIWFKPYGPWGQYNNPTMVNLLSGFHPHNLSIALVNSFVRPLTESVLLSPMSVTISTVLVAIVVFWQYKHQSLNETQSSLNDNQFNKLFIVGCFGFLLAHYPYFAIGREDTIPSLYDWYSRHQLLVPLGASLMIYALFSHAHRWIRRGLLVWLLMLFVIMNWTVYTEYQRDFLKQQSLVAVFQQSPILWKHHTFYVDDQLRSYNARNRGFRTMYEYQGLFKQAFHSEDRIGMDYSFFQTRFILSKDDPERRLFFRVKYMFNLSDYQDAPTEYTVTVLPGAMLLNSWNVWFLTWEYFINPVKFERDIIEISKLKFKPFTIEDVPK